MRNYVGSILMEWTEVLRNMSLKKGLLACAVIIMIIMTYRHLTYEHGYCSAKRLISDAEFIDKSVRLFKSQIEYFGGIDALRAAPYRDQ